MSASTVSALYTGVQLDPDVPAPGRASLADLTILAPRWLSRPLDEAIAVVWLADARPIACVGIDLDDADAMRRLRSAVREAGSEYCDTAVLAYTSQERCDGLVATDDQLRSMLERPLLELTTVLVRIDTDAGDLFYRKLDQPWTPIGTAFDPSRTIASLDADSRAWGRWGVLDATGALGHRDPRWPVQVPRERRARAEMSATERYHDGQRAVELAQEMAFLPGPGHALAMGGAVLDCRTLAWVCRAFATTPAHPRLDPWLWAARLLPGEGHWAAGMAGLGCHLAGRRSAARMALARQAQITDDNRTRVLADAVLDEISPTQLQALIAARAWDCDRPCCTNQGQH
ncbi:hypothetical protein [Glycomyces sp. MUSA5-2]|uniref:hypothetical protein n=1 Tax=Glycomyces sp. MUSA5-2 TaxID=2053002 RepID=UPI003008FFC8